MRNLAQKSAEAAKNTTALIAGSVTAVSTGTKIADETAQSITEVVNGTREVAGVITQIATAASEELSSQAQMLRSLVSRFKLKSDS